MNINITTDFYKNSSDPTQFHIDIKYGDSRGYATGLKNKTAIVNFFKSSDFKMLMEVEKEDKENEFKRI
jgi:hypothetical protein